GVIAVVNREKLLRRQRADAVFVAPLADSTILDVVGKAIFGDDCSCRVLHRHVGQTIAVVPGILRQLIVADSRFRQAVAFVVVGVIVCAVAQKAIAGSGGISRQRSVAVGVIRVAFRARAAGRRQLTVAVIRVVDRAF